MHHKSRGLAAIARKGLTIFLASILVFDGVPTAALTEALDAADAVVEEALVEEGLPEGELPEEGLPEEVDSGEGLPEQEPSDQSEPLEAEETGEPEALPEEAAEDAETADDEQEAPADKVDADEIAADHEENSASVEDEEEPALTAQADDDLVASGEWGECSWSIDNDGLLRIWPTNGVSGVLADSRGHDDDDSLAYFPWYQYRDYVVSVVADEGVILPRNCVGMFYRFSRLEAANLSSINTSSVSYMDAMYWGCSSLTSLDIAGWDTSGVESMESMFRECSALSALDISTWDTSSLKTISWMFEGCEALSVLTLSGWNTSSVVNMDYTFSGCCNLVSLDVADWDMGSAESIVAMFEGCSSLTTLDLSRWNTASVVDISRLFIGCSRLASIYLSEWDTSSLERMVDAFGECSSLTSLGISNWDVSSVVDMSGAFTNCSLLASLDVSNWDTSSLNWAWGTFYGCSSLQSLDLTSWDMSSVENLGPMFNGCTSLSSLNVSNWDTSAVASISMMFAGCSSLETLDLSSWSSESLQEYDRVFLNMYSLSTLTVGSSFDLSRVFPYPETETGKWWSAAEGAWFDTETIRAERAYQADTYTTYIPYGFLEGAEVNFAPEAFVFNGAETRPSISLSFDGEPLVEGTDYVASYEDNVNAGTATVRVTGIGDWRGEVLRTYEIAHRPVVITADSFTKSYGDPDPVFTAQVEGLIDGYTVDYELVREPGEGLGTYVITPTGEAVQGNYELTFQSGTLVIDSASLQQATVAEIADQIFTGSAITPLPVVMLGGETLVEGTDYTVSYQDNVNAGTAAVIITGIGRYSDSTEQSFTIAPKPVTVTVNSVTKTHGQDDPVFSATVSGTVGNDTVSCTISREAGERPGTYVVTASGASLQGNYAVTFVSGSLEIAGVSLAEATVSSIATQTYSGFALKPSVTVSHAGMRLEEGTDYTVTYQNNTNAGTATITVKGVGAFWGQKTTTFTIAPKAVTVRADNLSKGYGEADPELTATVVGLIGGDSVTYSLARAQGEAVGTYSIVATGNARQGNYQVTFQNGTFTIGETLIGGAAVSAIPNQTYTGSGIIPQPLVTLGGTTLSLGTDYSLSYRNNVNVGTATVTISGMGGYAGSLSKTFVISPKAAMVTADSLCKELGQADPALTATVEGLVGNDELVYTLSREVGESLGTYAITATGNVLQGNYRVTYKSGVLTIGLVSIARATIDGIPQRVYDGTSQVPKVIVTLDGKTLVEGRDYTLAYRNNVNPGTATVIVSGTGDYGGSVEATFVIAPRPVTVTVNSKTKAIGEPDPTLTATVKGVVGGDTISYELAREAGELPGTYAITASGDEAQGNYLVTFVGGYLTIDKAAVADVVVEPIADQVYSGAMIEPELSVSVRGMKLERGRDYVVSFADNTNAGQASVVVTGAGAFEGSITRHFTIAPREVTVRALDATKTYGDADPLLRATISGTLGGDTVSYEITRRSGENVGTYAIVPTGEELQGNYLVAFATGTLEVTPREAAVTPDNLSKSYGEADPTFTATVAGLLDDDAIEYMLSREPGEARGTYAITASGDELQGNYRVTYGSASFEITGVSISGATIAAIPSCQATGQAIEPKPKVTLGGKILVRGQDYVLSYRNNVSAGTATVVVTGIGKYFGEVTATFKIEGRSLEGAKVLLSKLQYEIYEVPAEPNVTVYFETKDGGLPVYLVKDVDYTVSYLNNTAIGTATAVVTGKGSYEGTLQQNYWIARNVIAGTFSGGLRYSFADGRLIIGGEGAMTSAPPVKSSWDTIHAVIIQEGVTSICSKAFSTLGSIPLSKLRVTSVSLPESLTRIGDNAFYGLTTLQSVNLPNGLLTIEHSAFSGCRALTSVTLPASLMTIGDYAFKGCTALQGIVLPSGLRSIGEYAFENCTTAFGKKLDIPRSVTTIGKYAFDTGTSASSIQKVEFAGNAPSIGYWAFHGITADAIYPAGNKTWTDDLKKNYGGTLTWYMRKSNGTLEQEPYKSSYNTVSLTENLNSCSYYTLWSTDSLLDTDDATVSFDMEIKKKSRVCVALKWRSSSSDTCIHGHLHFDVIDNYGNTLHVDHTSQRDGQGYFIIDDCPAGTLHLEIQFLNDHEYHWRGFDVAYYVLQRYDIANATVQAVGTLPTTGKAVEPLPKVTLTSKSVANRDYDTMTFSSKNVTLKAGRDYTLTYKNNVKAGTASVTIKGKGRYTGSKTIKFKLADPKPLSKTKINAIGTQWWKGKKLTPVPVIKDGNKTLKKGTDFTVTYTNNAKVGKATVTIKGKGLYKGTVKRTFNIKNISGTWKKSGSRWWYEWKDGTYPKSMFYTISGKTYRFDASGYMLTGWQKVGSKYYFFGSDGVMRKNTWAGNYWLKADGTMATNEWVDGGKYWVGANGAWVKGKTR